MDAECWMQQDLSIHTSEQESPGSGSGFCVSQVQYQSTVRLLTGLLSVVDLTWQGSIQQLPNFPLHCHLQQQADQDQPQSLQHFLQPI